MYPFSGSPERCVPPKQEIKPGERKAWNSRKSGSKLGERQRIPRIKVKTKLKTVATIHVGTGELQTCVPGQEINAQIHSLKNRK